MRWRHGTFEYIYDDYASLEAVGTVPYDPNAEARLVAALGRSEPRKAMRDDYRLKGWVGATERMFGRGWDKGHFIAHSIGGAVDGLEANVFIQRRDLNRRVPSDWWLVGFTAALFVAALLQFGAMWVHAHTLHRSLGETKKSAEAAATLARSSAIQLRAQLIVKIHHPIQGLEVGKSPRIGFDIINTGLTPANECTYETWVAVLPHPFTDFPPNTDYFKVSNKSTIYPDHVPVGSAIDLGHDLTQNQMNGIQQNLWRLCFRIHVEYRDVFREQRFANFGYSANDHAIEPLPKYNDSN